MNGTDDAAIQALRNLVNRLHTAIDAAELEAGEQHYSEAERHVIAYTAWEIGCSLDNLETWLSCRLAART